MLSAIYSSKKHEDEGFTLLELLIVVIVIGVLAAIALPIFLNQQKAAVDASVVSDVRNSVAQVAGAQALKLNTVKATVSRDGTNLVLAVAGGASKTATTADATFTNVPATGTAYTLSGYNASGSKFTSATSPFKYDGATGQFSNGSAAPSDGGNSGGNNSGGPSSDSGIADDTGYAGSVKDFSFNGYTGIGSSSPNAVNDTILRLSGGWYSSDEDTLATGPGFGKGLIAFGTPGGDYSTAVTDFAPTDLKLYDKSGKLLAAHGDEDGNCAFRGAYYNWPSLAFYGAPYDTLGSALPKNSLYGTLSCGIVGGRIDQAAAESLQGGRVTFTSANGESNSIPISAPIDYTRQVSDDVVNTTIASTPQSGNLVKYGFDFSYTKGASGGGQAQNLGTTGAVTHSDVPFFDNVAPGDHTDNSSYAKALYATAEDVKFFTADGNDVTSTVVTDASPLESCSVNMANMENPSAAGYYYASANIRCNWIGDGIPMSTDDFRTLLTGGHIEVAGNSFPLGNLAG